LKTKKKELKRSTFILKQVNKHVTFIDKLNYSSETRT